MLMNALGDEMNKHCGDRPQLTAATVKEFLKGKGVDLDDHTVAKESWNTELAQMAELMGTDPTQRKPQPRVAR